jgi:type I restriction enzyme M protein
MLENNPIKELESKIWESANILRGSISTDNFHVILFFITLKKIGFKYEPSNTNSSILNSINDFLQEYDNKNKTKYLAVYNVYSNIVGSLPNNQLLEIFHLFDALDRELLQSNFTAIFDKILNQVTQSFGIFSGLFILPTELSSMMINLVSVPNQANIYNPFAGTASLGTLTHHDSTYVGQETNQNAWAIGQLRLLAGNSILKKQLILGDCINEWNPTNDKFDVIIASPPFNFKLDHEVIGNFGCMKNYESYFIEKGLADLKDDGKLVAFVREGFLNTSGYESKLREYLVQEDLLETVIALPSGILNSVGVKTAVLLINKNKENKGSIRVVDAGNYIKSSTKREKQLDYESIMELIASNQINESQNFISNSEIIENDCNLSPSRYFFLNTIPELEPGHELIKFGDLVVPVLRNRLNLPEKGKLIRIRDLKEDNLEYSLVLDNIENNEIPRTAQKIDASCLLIALRWKTIKPTYFNFTGESIYITNDIIALQVDESKIDLEYLIHELHSDYVLNEIDSYRTGNTVPLLKKSDLLKINIVLPSFVEQKAKVKGAKEAFIQSRKKELELKQELLGLKDESFREFASIKHTFRQYLNALQSNVAGTKKFIANNEGTSMSLDMVYSKNLNKTFGEHLSGLEGTIQSMSKMLSSFDNLNEGLTTKKLNLLQLVTEAHNRFKNTDRFKFEKVYVDIDSFTMFDDSILAPVVSFNEDDFYRLYSNIVSNAIEHGFKDETKIYSIRTSISFDAKEKKCVLEIANNGIPMAKEFTIRHLTTRGEKTSDSNGTGIGGADIQAILDKYNGSFDIINQEDDFFPVTYLVKLPYEYEYTL